MATTSVKSRQEWLFNSCKNAFSKQALIDSYIKYMLCKTQQMFEYEGLPDTIPQRELELITQLKGNCTIGKDTQGNLYVFSGALGGVLNEYYLPTISIVVNPYLQFNKEFKIDKDCVVIWNDSLHIGLYPMFERNARLLAECDLTLRIQCINTRIPSVLSSDDDNSKESCKEYLEDVESGEKIGIIGTNAFISGSGLKSQSYNQAQSQIKDVIELKQYILSNWWIELGLNANYNMKREAINSSESAINEETLLPLIDDMLKNRQEGIEKVNKMFNLNINVKLSSAWQKLRDELEAHELNDKQIIKEDSKEDSKGGEDNETN